MRFGLDAPQRPGDFGLVVENGMAWLVRALEADETAQARKAPARPRRSHMQRLMPADALRMRGRHNAANALAALALATAAGCPLAPMLHGLREYRGEPHRVEPIAIVGGVEAFDDSKGTNVGATVAALNGLGADKAPARLVVILGGDGKGQDFTPLARAGARHARAVVLIGRDAALIERGAGAAAGVPMQRLDTLEAATRWAIAQAQPGDAVLLSPACASLDMFRNYAHRAEVFVAAVQRAGARAGGEVAMSALGRFRPRRAALRASRRRGRTAAAPRRCRCATGSASPPASRRGCSASTRRWCGSRWRCWRWAW